jgi:hypothetical protein
MNTVKARMKECLLSKKGNSDEDYYDGRGLLTFMFPMMMRSNENSDSRKEMKRNLPDNCNIINGLCQSLKNTADYRLHILNVIKEQLRNASMSGKW